MAEDRLVLRRTYDAPRERVFEAFTNARQLEKWYTPDIDAPVIVVHIDFRVGGEYRVEFGAAPGSPPYVEIGTYREIVPPSRLVFETTLRKGGETLASTHCTIEFIARGRRTELVMVETGFPPEVKEDRRGGWGRTLDNLVLALNA